MSRYQQHLYHHQNYIKKKFLACQKVAVATIDDFFRFEAINSAFECSYLTVFHKFTNHIVKMQ